MLVAAALNSFLMIKNWLDLFFCRFNWKMVFGIDVNQHQKLIHRLSRRYHLLISQERIKTAEN